MSLFLFKYLHIPSVYFFHAFLQLDFCKVTKIKHKIGVRLRKNLVKTTLKYMGHNILLQILSIFKHVDHNSVIIERFDGLYPRFLIF